MECTADETGNLVSAFVRGKQLLMSHGISRDFVHCMRCGEDGSKVKHAVPVVWWHSVVGQQLLEMTFRKNKCCELCNLIYFPNTVYLESKGENWVSDFLPSAGLVELAVSPAEAHLYAPYIRSICEWFLNLLSNPRQSRHSFTFIPTGTFSASTALKKADVAGRSNMNQSCSLIEKILPQSSQQQKLLKTWANTESCVCGEAIGCLGPAIRCAVAHEDHDINIRGPCYQHQKLKKILVLDESYRCLAPATKSIIASHYACVYYSCSLWYWSSVLSPWIRICS